MFWASHDWVCFSGVDFSSVYGAHCPTMAGVGVFSPHHQAKHLLFDHVDAIASDFVGLKEDVDAKADTQMDCIAELGKVVRLLKSTIARSWPQQFQEKDNVSAALCYLAV